MCCQSFLCHLGLRLFGLWAFNKVFVFFSGIIFRDFHLWKSYKSPFIFLATKQIVPLLPFLGMFSSELRTSDAICCYIDNFDYSNDLIHPLAVLKRFSRWNCHVSLVSFFIFPGIDSIC